MTSTHESTFSLQLGATIREARLDAGYTQDELARTLGVQPATVARYELGLRTPSVESLLTIAQTLGLPITALIPGADDVRGADIPVSLRTIVRALQERPALLPGVLALIQTALEQDTPLNA
jgi:putative transcriptional regulator